jgi:hypothetical protein
MRGDSIWRDVEPGLYDIVLPPRFASSGRRRTSTRRAAQELIGTSCRPCSTTASVIVPAGGAGERLFR